MKDKILVVDDEAFIRTNLEKLFRLDGYEVFTAADGEQGLEIFEAARKRSDPIQIVLVDLKMPGMDGLEVLKKIKEGVPQTEVIIIIGHGAVESAIEALRMGAFDYITKPIDYDILGVSISRALEKQEMQRKLDGHLKELERRVVERTAELAQVNQELKEEIKEHENARDMLSATCRKLQATFNAIQENINIVDLDFNLTDVNAVMMKVFGLPDKESVIGRKCYEALKGRKEPCPNCAVAEAYRTKAAAYRTSTPGDEMSTGGRCFEIFAYPIMDEQEAVTGAVEFARDITERKQAVEALRKAYDQLEERVRERTAEVAARNVQLEVQIIERRQAEKRLRQSEDKYRTLLENLPQKIFHKDRDSVYVSCNGNYARDLKIDPSKIAGKTDYEFFPRELAEKYRADDQRIITSGETADIEEEYIVDGKKVFVHTVKTPVRDEKGNITGVLGIFWDITKHKRLEQQQKELECQLRQSQKMEAIGTLAGGIAHNFNNLLTGILGYASLMRSQTDPSHPHHRMLRTIEKEVQSGARLGQQLLRYARKGNYVFKLFDLNQLVEETAEIFGETKKQIIIHRDLAEDSLAIEADRGQIEQMLWNLFVNAADAMPRGGHLTLKTRNITHEYLKDKVPDVKPGRYVHLAVTDTGIGMDKKIMEYIFDPFFSTKEVGQGTGLGLSSVYGIIKDHGGYIDVESEKGRGTTFHIYLRVSERPVPEKVAVTPEEIFRGTETILLVEDEKANREVVQKWLESIGYRVLTAKDGKEAVEVYGQNRVV